MTRARLLLCTDLDRTLLPNGRQSESPGARRRFGEFVREAGIVLAYVTGRDRGRVEQAIANYGLPAPDYVITDAGTNIFDRREGEWRIWQQWIDEIARDWKGYSREQLAETLAGITELRPQEYSKQNRYKLSYYFPLHLDVVPLERAICEALSETGVAASFIWSIDEPAAVGLLDILPRHGTKLDAIVFLGKALGFDATRMLFAGDSGNDLPVLSSAIPSVLVANAMPEVVTQAIADAEQSGNERFLYVASGGFAGMNGNYSAGILEGVHHFHPDVIACHVRRWEGLQDLDDVESR